MLRYILLKLPGITSKTDHSVSSKCNHLGLLSPGSSDKREARGTSRKSDVPCDENKLLYHRRSYSFPAVKPKSRVLLDSRQLYGTWTSTDLQKFGGPEQLQKEKTLQRSRNCNKKVPSRTLNTYREHCTTVQSKKVHTDKFASKNKEVDKLKDDQSYNIGQYELEAARPRRSQSELLLNVFDYIPNDPTRYLQPNKQRPFGSTDNTYISPLMESRPKNLTEFSTQHLQSSQDSRISLKEEGLKTLSIERSLTKTEERPATADYYYKKKRKGYSSKELATYNELVQKHRDLNPSYVSKKLSPKPDEQALIDEAIRPVDKYKMKLPNTKDSNSTEKTMTKNKNNLFESYRLRWNEPGIKIEPPPFLNSTNMCSSVDFGRMEKTTKSTSDYKYQQAPWPAYSERVKESLEKSLAVEPIEIKNDSYADIAVLPDKTQKIQSNTLQRQMSRAKPLHIDREELHSSTNASAKEVPSNESIDTVHETPTRNESNISKCSVFVTGTPNKQPENPISLCKRKMYTTSNRTYARPSSTRKGRALEPPSCEKEKEPKKCFLPSKVRLKPPHCLATPPYRECNVENPCPPRADQCYTVLPKKLPVLQSNKCPCVEPHIPATNPKLRRLKFQFLDPPRFCPCKICPCPPRADDSRKEKNKKLPNYKPGNCECLEPPPMQDVPLVRLKKLCEPEEKCYPKPECPKPEPCERADDCWKERPKVLPILKSGSCPCVERHVPDRSPRMQRLKKMVFKDPPRICPCNPCPCPPRADDTLKQKIRKLPVYRPGHCECIEPPKMTDIPLKRLVKVCPPEVCNPPKICPVEVCDPTGRADFCLKEKPKKLPILKATKCTCIEPPVPNKNPKIKRLKMEFKDQPRAICDPGSPCPPRADDTLKPREKKLPVYVPGACKCIEPSPMVDVPLIKLKKICEPEEKCYPPEECPKPELCKDKPRADDDLCVRKKTLPHLKPKSCPCVEPPMMTDVPKLKRLDLFVPEPEKYCPTKSCADYPRADDNLKEKNRKLPRIKSGECPCIEQPMVDVKPLPRLKCKDEEEPCVCDDPCIIFPRADWGCWEYTEDITEKVNKCKKSALKKKKVTVNTKRRYNTDSKVNKCNKTKPENKNKNETDKLSFNKVLDTNSLKDDLKLKPSNINKLINKELKGESKSELNFKSSKPERPMTAPTSCKHSCTFKGIKQEKALNSTLTFQLRPNKSKSQPIMKLLKKLGDLEKFSNNSNLHHDKKIDLRVILNKISINRSFDKRVLNTNVRELSTDIIRPEETVVRLISTGSINCAKKDCKDKKKCNTKKPKKCKMDECEKVVLKNCPQKTQLNCNKERRPVCCEKKPSPFPAFSECRDEEVEPYSRKVRHWTCNNRQFGFEPKPKKKDDSLKNKKHFSTTTDTSYQHSKAVNITNKLDGHRTLQFNSSHILCPRRIRSLSHTNFSTTANNTCIKDFNNQFPRYESSFQNKKRNRRKRCKKRKCPKFTLSDCPPKERERCEVVRRLVCKKRQSPYPAFSDCMDDDLEEGINECPLERDKIDLLQPKRPMEKPKLVDKLLPNQGLIDPTVEEDCLRAKHCVKKEGISQSCADFGKSIKLLKSRDFPRPRDPDCDKIEELKNIGRWPPESHRRRFCTSTNSHFDINKRKFYTPGCTFSVTSILEQNKTEILEATNSGDTNKIGNWRGIWGQEYCKNILSKSKELFGRNYHVLCNNEKRNVVDDVDKKIKDIPQNQFADIDEPCKYMKLRNVQWRINNFQKWRRLNKLSTLQGPVKHYHTCSKLKCRHFVKYSPITKTFSTSQCQVISEFPDYALRGISTTMILAKQRSNKNACSKRDKNSFNSKKCNINKDCPKFKLDCPPRERFMYKRKRVVEKVVTPYPAFSECHDEEIGNTIMECPLGKERIQRLQPQYPLVPEIETVNLPPPYQEGIDRNLEIDCLRHKLGLTNEGITQDCETFGQPIKYLKCKHIAGFSSTKSETFTKTTCSTKKKAARKKYKKRAKGEKKEAKRCPEPCPVKCPSDTCLPPPKQDCKESLWQRVVNYFKARPNCPAPDEWKKRALREKAEKAAKAAGLCLIDPKDVKIEECKEPEELPKVITPQDSDCHKCERKQNQLERCSYNKRNTGDSCSTSNRRHLCTFSKRFYSQNVNWKYFDEFNKLVEEEKNKRTVEEPFTSVIDQTNSLNEAAGNKDDDARCPDSYCLKVFNEAILNKEKLNDITKYVEMDIIDEPVDYSLQILPTNKDFMDILFNEPVDEFTNYSQAKAISAFQEYVNKMDALTEISYEDIENSKTNNLIKELNKLLDNKNE